MSINKQDLVDIMANKADISKAAAETALNTFLEKITDTLVKREKVVLIGWGTWETSNRAARTGRNPQTGAAMQIPAAVVAKFKAGKKLKEAVNQG